MSLDPPTQAEILAAVTPSPPKPSSVVTLLIREDPAALSQTYPGMHTNVIWRLLDDNNETVVSGSSSNGSWAERDGRAEADRRGLGLHYPVVDQTATGRPWMPLPLAGLIGCPLCGGVAWDAQRHAAQCPPEPGYDKP